MASMNNDLSIDQLLSDPVTVAVMRADRVDPTALQAMLRGVAARLHDARDNAAPAIPARSIPFFGNPALKGHRFLAGGRAPFDRCRAP
jgi:hypothetical protein